MKMNAFIDMLVLKYTIMILESRKINSYGVI